MKRRSFVKSTIISSAAATVLPVVSKAMEITIPIAASEYYELKVYSLKDETQQKLVEDYLENAAIPAVNKLGVKHVGVFTEMKSTGQTKLFVLTQYNSLEHFITVKEGLAKDAAFVRKGADYLNAPAKQPAYERIESSLLKAFTHFPTLTAPEKKTRVFELRQYQSASEAAAKKKR